MPDGTATTPTAATGAVAASTHALHVHSVAVGLLCLCSPGLRVLRDARSNPSASQESSLARTSIHRRWFRQAPCRSIPSDWTPIDATVVPGDMPRAARPAELK